MTQDLAFLGKAAAKRTRAEHPAGAARGASAGRDLTEAGERQRHSGRKPLLLAGPPCVTMPGNAGTFTV